MNIFPSSMIAVATCINIAASMKKHWQRLMTRSWLIFKRKKKPCSNLIRIILKNTEPMVLSIIFISANPLRQTILLISCIWKIFVCGSWNRWPALLKWPMKCYPRFLFVCRLHNCCWYIVSRFLSASAGTKEDLM